MALFYAPQCASTMPLVSVCAEMMGVDKPTALYTFHQTQGRGQQNHTWDAEPGKNIAYSILFYRRPGQSPVVWNKAITLAVRDAIAKLTQLKVQIKWPNDIYIIDRKVCGILLEGSVQGDQNGRFCAGIGINVNQKSWPGNYPAISLSEVCGEGFDLLDVVHEVTDYIAKYMYMLSVNNISEICEQYDQNLWQLGNVVMLNHAGGAQTAGKLAGVDADGRLLVEQAGELNAYHHGQVRLNINKLT